ncbi:MAG: hypothetical protein QXZ68_06120 [Candidatus Bathyarchaeia archaeon]
MESDEIYSIALKNVLEEVRKICPEVQHAFVYNENGEIVAGDAETPQKVMVQVVDAFDDILERAEALGGVEAVTLKGDMGTVKLYHFNGHYLVMVYSAKADVGYVDTIVRVLYPTVLKVLENLSPTPTKQPIQPVSEPVPQKPQPEPEQPIVKPAEEPAREIEESEGELPKAEQAPEIIHEPIPEVPAVQLIVENIGGLLVPSDTVRVDSETLSGWENTFEGKKIEYVEVETFEGKTARFKVKPIKDAKYAGKGVVQIPEKAQLALEIKKGELVKVKPIIE